MKNKILTAAFAVLFMLPMLQVNAQKVVGYWPYYRSGLSSFNYSNYTDLVYAFLNPNQWSGTLNFNDAKFSQSDFNLMVSLCNQNNVKPHVSIGGASLSGPIASVAANPTYRATFIAEIVQFVAGKHAKNSKPLAGVDIDWEFPKGSAEVAAHLALCTELKAALDAEGTKDGRKYELAIAVGGSTPGMPTWQSIYHTHYFDKKVINHVDYIYQMNYDLQSLGYANSHHSSYQACVDAFEYFTNTLGFPPSKVIMGIPFYGRNSWQALSWTDFASQAAYDDADGVYNGYSYNSKPVIESKVSYICSKGGGGALVWEAAQDNKTYSLGKALWDAFVANKCTPVTTGGGDGGTTQTGDCLNTTGFNDDYDQEGAPSDGEISMGYWGTVSGVYAFNRKDGDLDITVNQAENGWTPMGFSLTNEDKNKFIDVTGNGKAEVSLTNSGSANIEVYFSFISNNNSGQLVTAGSDGVLFGAVVEAGETFTRTFDLTTARKHSWVGESGPCIGGDKVGVYCLKDVGFDPKNLSGVEWSINGAGATVDGKWVQAEIKDHPVKIHYIRAGGGDCEPTVTSQAVPNANALSVYPNPATEVLNIEYNGSEVSVVTVTDVNGQVVYTSQIGGGSNKVTINSSALASGLYFVSLNNGQENTVQKVVVK